MSTVPGAESWYDAGLLGPEPEDVVELETSAEEAEDPEEYTPEPEPVLSVRESTEADFVEQLIEVPDDEDEEYP